MVICTNIFDDYCILIISPSAMIFATTAAARDALMNLKNQEGLVKIIGTRTSVKPEQPKRTPKKQQTPEFSTYQINQQEFLRIKISDSEKHFPLHIHSLGSRNDQKQQVSRIEIGLEPDFQTTVLPKIENYSGEDQSYDHKDVMHLLNKSCRPKSASAFRNKQLSNNPFFFNLPHENQRGGGSSRFPGAPKRESHLKSFGSLNSNISQHLYNHMSITPPRTAPPPPSLGMGPSSVRIIPTKNSGSVKRGLFV